MAVLSPLAKTQFVDVAGEPLVGGKLYTYAAGTTTPQTTYTDSSGANANSNPIILDTRGEASIWLGSNAYKFKLTDPNDSEIWTVDYISAPSTALSPVFAGNVTIDSDSGGPALRITQTGSGNVLTVQDSADPDITPFVIDSSGRVGIGTGVPNEALEVADGVIQISSGVTARSKWYADGTKTTITAEGARDFVVRTNSADQVTINSTAVTSVVPVVLPGSPTTNLQAATKAYVDTAQTTAAPAGIIAPFAGTSAPTGWLACEGQTVSRTTYATLFAAIGTAWGAGDGSTTFRLPDLRGMFLRGTGTNATGSSSGAVGPAVGVYAADTYLNHNHTATDSGHTHSTIGFATPGLDPGGTTYGTVSGSATSGFGYASITVATSTTGGTETKPKNYGILYIIKT